jgi:CHAT domain-containing protein
VVSSYTPTLTALLEARRNSPTVTTTGSRLLLASAARYHDLPSLPSVTQEVATVAAMVPSDNMITLEQNERMWGYGEEVLRRLPEATILHLACHGIQDYEYPLNSTFRLGKGRIDLRDILHLKLDNAFLAFLSACETVKGFAALQDEVFHLGSAMLFTGFRSVIGTMW